jgi:hypothetical protein
MGHVAICWSVDQTDHYLLGSPNSWYNVAMPSGSRPLGPVTGRKDLDLGLVRQFRIVATLARAIPSAVVLLATPAGAPLARVGPHAELAPDRFHQLVARVHHEQTLDPLTAALRLPPSSCPLRARRGNPRPLSRRSSWMAPSSVSVAAVGGQR